MHPMHALQALKTRSLGEWPRGRRGGGRRNRPREDLLTSFGASPLDGVSCSLIEILNSSRGRTSLSAFQTLATERNVKPGRAAGAPAWTKKQDLTSRPFWLTPDKKKGPERVYSGRMVNWWAGRSWIFGRFKSIIHRHLKRSKLNEDKAETRQKVFEEIRRWWDHEDDGISCSDFKVQTAKNEYLNIVN